MLASDLPAWLVRAVALLFGAIWGSFFNVAIYRWPRDQSVVSPPSTCTSCGTRIPARHNIPIVGWLLLRGRAACCGAPISSRYPLVELLSAVLAAALAERFLIDAQPETSLTSAGIEALLYFAFVGGLLIATFVDLDFMEIPDEVSLPGAALGLATVGLRQEPGALDAAIGAGGGFLLVQLVFVWAYERLAGRRGMGEGDGKLLLMIGAFLGWQGAIAALVLGAFQGLVVTFVMLALGKSPTPDAAASEDEDDGRKADEPDGDEASKPDAAKPVEKEAGEKEKAPVGRVKVPYGPFLALGALEFLFFGGFLLDRYFALFE